MIQSRKYLALFAWKLAVLLSNGMAQVFENKENKLYYLVYLVGSLHKIQIRFERKTKPR
jgi:hypothetical protein